MYNVSCDDARACGHHAAMPVTFWDRFFDSDHRRRTDIGDLQDREEAITDEIASHASQLHRLEEQVEELSMTVAALMKVMAEVGQLDPLAVRLRVKAELVARLPSVPAPQTRVVQAHSVKEQPPELTVDCARCGARVRQPTISDAGTLCDECEAIAERLRR
jgi:hypothetical protein